MGPSARLAECGLLILLLTMTGCLYPSYIDTTGYPQKTVSPSADPGYSADLNANYQNAMSYVAAVQQSYRSFLVSDARESEGFGVLLIAAGGAALGIAAAGDSTLAITELGIGGGTLLGAPLWLQNKPKLNAYLVGITADQCIIDNGVLIQPSVTRAPAIYSAMEALKGPLGLLHEDLASTTNPSNPANQPFKDAAAAGDQAMIAGQAALDSIALSGPMIIRSTQDVDTRVFAAAYKAEPDLAALSSGFTSLQKLPFSQSATTSAQTNKNGGNLATSSNQVIKLTNDLQNALGGLTLATKDFAS